MPHPVAAIALACRVVFGFLRIVFWEHWALCMENPVRSVNRRWRILCFVEAALVAASSAAPSVSKVEPPNWWAHQPRNPIRALLTGAEPKSAVVVGPKDFRTAVRRTSDNDHHLFRPRPKKLAPGPLAGAPPPSDAIVLFDGKNLCYWVTAGPDGQIRKAKWKVEIYAQWPPLVNASRPEGERNVYDILFKAPRCEEEKFVKSGYIRVAHNGVLVHHRCVRSAWRRRSAEPAGSRQRRPL